MPNKKGRVARCSKCGRPVKMDRTGIYDNTGSKVCPKGGGHDYPGPEGLRELLRIR